MLSLQCRYKRFEINKFMQQNKGTEIVRKREKQKKNAQILVTKIPNTGSFELRYCYFFHTQRHT